MAPTPAIDSLSPSHDPVLSITRLKGKVLDATNPMPAAKSPRRGAGKANAGHRKKTADEGSLAAFGADVGGDAGPKAGEGDGDGAHIASPSGSRADKFPPISDRTRRKVEIERVRSIMNSNSVNTRARMRLYSASREHVTIRTLFSPHGEHVPHRSST